MITASLLTPALLAALQFPAGPVPLPADTSLGPDTALVSAPEPVRVEVPEAIRRRWATPFSVESSGRPPAREPRPVVILRDTARATPPATAAAPATAEPPAAAPPRAAAPAAGGVAGARTHRIEWGETWYGIARQYGVAPRVLAAANPGVDPEHIRSGEVLRIPRGATGPMARRTHTVADGETLWGIARRYGVSTEALRRANRLTDTRIHVGQTLTIPQEERR